MTAEEQARIVREFKEAKELVRQLNQLTQRIEVAADRAIEAYRAQGAENGAI